MRCGECGKPAPVDANGRARDTVANQPMCPECLNDYLAEAGAEYRVCGDCGKWIDPLEVFPKQRCVDCHAKSPEVRLQTATMTAERLARMWGAK